jgi:phosphohistidine swiveling domain-containing protein
MKKTVDFLPADQLDELLPPFKDARIYSERIYSDTERFFRKVTALIATREHRNADELTCLTQLEFERYLREQQLPNVMTLTERFKASALWFDHGKLEIFLESKVDELEASMLKAQTRGASELRGIVGYPGNVKGVVRVVDDPYNPGEFNNGDILVTGMTRPEFLPLMQKASAIVTDAGGILCHAAISARELKVPCIVGTEIATKVLKNGEVVIVDANMGVIFQ